MKWRLLLSGGVLAIAIVNIMNFTPVGASSISIAPLKYQANLQANDYKKGYVDIVNPEAQPIEVHLKVQAFRQTDNQGSLQFYDDAAITAGVKLDLSDVSLGPNEGARIYFILDASQLPSGDVFAAILASTGATNQHVVSVPSAQVGTLLLLENGMPPAHHATINQLSANWLQLGSTIAMQLTITNTDPATGSALGFSPQIDFAFKPYSNQTVNGPLIFAGRSRIVDYTKEGSYFGPLLLQATVNGHTQSKLVFAITGYWQWLTPLVLFFLIALFISAKHWLKKHPLKHVKKQG